MFYVRKIILLAGLAAFSVPASADLFIYQTPDGSRMLTDHLLSDPNYRLIRSSLANHGAGTILAGRNRQFFRINPKAYDNLIARMAKAHDVDGGLIKAVIFVESKFNPYATSSQGGRGRLIDDAQNIEAGVLHLKYLLNRYRNKKLAIAAYNAGQTNVDRYQGIPPYSETRNYVKRVLRYSKIYKSEFKRDS